MLNEQGLSKVMFLVTLRQEPYRVGAQGLTRSPPAEEVQDLVGQAIH